MYSKNVSKLESIKGNQVHTDENPYVNEFIKQYVNELQKM